jgi:hypothetical protein
MLSFLFAVAEGIVEAVTVVTAGTIAFNTTKAVEDALKDKRN